MNEFGIDTGTSTAGSWTCPNCGAVVPNGELHVCGNRAKFGPGAGVWELANPLWPPKKTALPTYADSVTRPIADLEERRVRALERIADALERLAQGNG